MSTPAPASMPVAFGVSAETGEFSQPFDRSSLQILRKEGPGGTLSKGVITQKATSGEDHLGMAGGTLIVGGQLAVEDLKKAGWGVLFGASVSDAIKKELKPLLDHRHNEVGSDELFKVYTCQPGQSATEWLSAASDNKASMDELVDPPTGGVPFYLLIVAPPEEISFEFQYELDLNWGVGRIWFSTPEEFGCYARSVCDYEKAKTVSTSRQLGLFATRQDFDPASQLLHQNVFVPLIKSDFGKDCQFKLQTSIGPAATKNTLNSIWSGDSPGGTPALLFTGSHGLLRAPDSKHLADTQGAIVCQDWPGGVPKPDHYYAARDLPQTVKVHGMIHFLFACYGGGWPQFDTYQRPGGQPVEISPSPMLARLPQALLGRENGALAVLGHVDRAWSYSYTSNGKPQNQGFRDVLLQLMSGYRLGNATDQFNYRWAVLSSKLPAYIDSVNRGDGKFSAEQLANQWVARDDARNYILFGDPAVRLRVKDM